MPNNIFYKRILFKINYKFTTHNFEANIKAANLESKSKWPIIFLT